MGIKSKLKFKPSGAIKILNEEGFHAFPSGIGGAIKSKILTTKEKLKFILRFLLRDVRKLKLSDEATYKRTIKEYLDEINASENLRESFRLMSMSATICEDLERASLGEFLSILQGVLKAKLKFGHNVETVPRLYDEMRKGADYERSLSILSHAARKGAVTKSALVLGMGESDAETTRTIRDLRIAGVHLLAIGQYLQPTLEQVPVARYVTPDEFEFWRDFAINIGFASCVSGPFVRSSFRAAEEYERIT